MFSNDDLLLFVLDEGREVIGKWENQVGVPDDYIKVSGACFSGIGMMNTPQGQRQVKVLIPADEQGGFSKDVFVRKDKIAFIKKAIYKSPFYVEYIKVTTGIEIPVGDIPPLKGDGSNIGKVLPFKRIK